MLCISGFVDDVMFANKRALHARVVLATNTLESAEMEISAALWVRMARKWLLFMNLYNLTVTDLWSVHRQDKLTRREIALLLVGFRSSNKHADWRGDSSNDDSNAPNDFYAMPFLYPALRLLCFLPEIAPVAILDREKCSRCCSLAICNLRTHAARYVGND